MAHFILKNKDKIRNANSIEINKWSSEVNKLQISNQESNTKNIVDRENYSNNYSENNSENFELRNMKII